MTVMHYGFQSLPEILLRIYLTPVVPTKSYCPPLLRESPVLQGETLVARVYSVKTKDTPSRASREGLILVDNRNII